MKSLLNNGPWKLAQNDREAIKKAQEALDCSEVFARLAVRRFGKDISFVAKKKKTHPPHLLKDLPRAANRISKSLGGKEKIFVHGDFDVDGLSSAAIIYRGLKKLTEVEDRIQVELGKRKTGHGLNYRVTSRIVEEDFDLLVTTDCGIKSTEEIARLEKFGVDTLVTDHHKIPEVLPGAEAVINPKREDCNYPNQNLSGAGIAYKLMDYLLEKEGMGGGHDDLIQLAMLGTVADLSPLIAGGDAENKEIVKKGLDSLRENPLVGLSAILDQVNKEGRLTTRDISYLIAPKLNAANRVGDPRVGFLLLISQDESRARYLANILEAYNKDRSNLQKGLVSEAKEKIKKKEVKPEESSAIIVKGVEWNPGIIGLIASKVADKYQIPAVAISVSGNKCRGSVRSGGKGDIEEGLDHCSDHLTSFGGHSNAGGFLMEEKDFEDFESCFQEWAKKNGTRESGERKKKIDAELEGGKISKSLYREISKLGPFGVANPQPVFLLNGAEIQSARLVGKTENHLKLKVEKGGEKFGCIGFGMGEEALKKLKNQRRVNPVFKLELNNWRGNENLQLHLKDFVL